MIEMLEEAATTEAAEHQSESAEEEVAAAEEVAATPVAVKAAAAEEGQLGAGLGPDDLGVERRHIPALTGMRWQKELQKDAVIF